MGEGAALGDRRGRVEGTCTSVNARRTKRQEENARAASSSPRAPPRRPTMVRNGCRRTHEHTAPHLSTTLSTLSPEPLGPSAYLTALHRSSSPSSLPSPEVKSLSGWSPNPLVSRIWSGFAPGGTAPDARGEQFFNYVFLDGGGGRGEQARGRMVQRRPGRGLHVRAPRGAGALPAERGLPG